MYYVDIHEKSNESSSYERISITNGDTIENFDSGDFIKDWFNAMKYLNDQSVNGVFPMFITSSQLNHLSDYGVYYESGYLREVDGVSELHYLDRTKENWWEDNQGVTNGLEFFVKDNTWTFEQLKDYCNGNS